MKWFKHYENATSNRFIQALINDSGLEDGMRYWLLLEALCKEFKKDTTVFIFSESQLKDIFKIKFTKKLTTFIQKLNNFSATFDQKLLNFSELSGNFWKIETPIMLELMGKDFKRTRLERGNATAKKKEEELEEELELEFTTTDDAENLKSKPKSKKQPRGHLSEFAGNPVIENLLSNVTASAQKAWMDCYVNTEFISQQILQAHAWIESNPSRRPKDFGRFMSNFLARGYENYRRKNILGKGSSPGRIDKRESVFEHMKKVVDQNPYKKTGG